MRLRSNLIAEFRSHTHPEKSKDISRKMLIDGSFRDVHYSNRDIANWKPVVHLDRLLVLAQTYNEPNSDGYLSTALADKVNLGLKYWFHKKPRSDNWWHNDIGQQLRIGPILVLMHLALPSSTVYSGLRYLKDPSEIPSKMTGQNLLWFASQGIYRGVISENNDDIYKNIMSIGSEIKISLNEGIQSDLSFHQHGPLLYSGGYGFAFIRDIIQWIGLFEGSGFQLPQDKIDFVATVLLNGLRWMVRGPNIDPSIGGREISRPDYALRGPAIIKMCQTMAQILPVRRSELFEFIDEINSPSAPEGLVGSRGFFRSDYLIHRSPKHFFSLRMFSKRTIGTEMINNENIKGFWLPFGLTIIQKDGTEHQDIFPVWNWSRLPGVTSPQITPPTTKTVTSDVEMVSVLAQGNTALGTMIYPQHPVKSIKSWFFFDHDMVALGDGITSSQTAPIYTALEQTLAQTLPAFVDGSPMDKPAWSKSVNQWVWFQNTTYVLLSPQTAIAEVQLQKGRWKDINLAQSEDLLEKNVFSMWIDHGIRPQGVQYAYHVINGLPLKESMTYMKSTPVVVQANNSTVQMVFHKPSQTTGVVFHQPARIDLASGFTLSVSRPCVMIINESPDRPWLTIAPIDSRPDSVLVKTVSPDGTTSQWTAHFSSDPYQEKKNEHSWPL